MRRTFLYICIMCLAAINLYSSFENSYFGARMNGMGGSFVAIADDYHTAILNPAGLALIDKLGFSFSYAKPYWGFDEEVTLDNYFFSMVYPNANVGSFNLYYSRFAVGNLYYENVYSFNYGVSVNQFYKSLSFKLHTGIGMKMLNKAYQLDKRAAIDPVFQNGTSKSGFSFDWGVIVSPFQKGTENYYNVGFSVNNINEPDMGMKSEDLIYRKYNAGFAYYLVKPGLLKGSIITPSVQYESSHENSYILLGIETWILRKLIGIRGGWNKNEISAGLSLNIKFASKFETDFDYSFLLPNQLVENKGTHNFSLTIKFLKFNI